MQNFKYLYLDDKTTKQPKTFIDWYKTFIPYLLIKKIFVIQSQKEGFDPMTAFNELENDPNLNFDPTKDLSEYSDEEMLKIENALKEKMFDSNLQVVDMLNTNMLFLINFYKNKVVANNTGDYALSINNFFAKCKDGNVGLDILEVENKDDSGNIISISHRIILNDAYRYFYKNLNYLTIGNLADYIFADAEDRLEFSHFIMKYHLLSDADGRKALKNGNPEFPDLSTSFVNALPVPNLTGSPDPNVWEYNDGLKEYISKDNEVFTKNLGSYNTRNGVLLGFNSTTEPLVKISSKNYTEVNTNPYYYEVTLYNAMNYLHTKYECGIQLFSSGHVENRRYNTIYHYDNYMRIYFPDAASMSTFDRLVVYI